MLVLSRKIEEKILIGDGIVVTLLRIGKGSVRLGIEADANVKVLRGELRDAAKDIQDDSGMAGLSGKQ